MRYAALAEAMLWGTVFMLGFAVAVMVTVMAGNLVRERTEQGESTQKAAANEAVAPRTRCEGCNAPTPTPVALTPEPKPASPELADLKTEMIDLGFALAVLLALDVEPSAWSVRFLEEWARNEGAYAARYNPLATTRGAPGSTCYNEVCVRHYPDFETGVAATVATLKQTGYAAIVDSLEADAITDRPAVGAALRLWGTVLLADKVAAGWSPSTN